MSYESNQQKRRKHQRMGSWGTPLAFAMLVLVLVVIVVLALFSI